MINQTYSRGKIHKAGRLLTAPGMAPQERTLKCESILSPALRRCVRLAANCCKSAITNAKPFSICGEPVRKRADLNSRRGLGSASALTRREHSSFARHAESISNANRATESERRDQSNASALDSARVLHEGVPTGPIRLPRKFSSHARSAVKKRSVGRTTTRSDAVSSVRRWSDQETRGWRNQRNPSGQSATHSLSSALTSRRNELYSRSWWTSTCLHRISSSNASGIITTAIRRSSRTARSMIVNEGQLSETPSDTRRCDPSAIVWRQSGKGTSSAAISAKSPRLLSPSQAHAFRNGGVLLI